MFHCDLIQSVHVCAIGTINDFLIDSLYLVPDNFQFMGLHETLSRAHCLYLLWKVIFLLKKVSLLGIIFFGYLCSKYKLAHYMLDCRVLLRLHSQFCKAKQQLIICKTNNLTSIFVFAFCITRGLGCSEISIQKYNIFFRFGFVKIYWSYESTI